MRIVEYVIRIEARDEYGVTIADRNQVIPYDGFGKNRPRMLISLLERFVRAFIYSQTKAEKRLLAQRRKPKKLGMHTLITGMQHD